MDLTGVSFWHVILAITRKWEDSNKNGVKIHKGTPYYFFVGELSLGWKQGSSICIFI
jgi:hypothetical protein